jgi:uridylate kinase
MTSLQIISLGGSIIAPQDIDVEFLQAFFSTGKEYLDRYPRHKLIIVCGGGAPARAYQSAYRKLVKIAGNAAQDWIGIAATRLNAELVRFIFQDFCSDPVVTDPTKAKKIHGQVLVAAGWKPGFSTDYDAVILAERFGAETVINLSNVEQVYSEDPKKNPKAVALKDISWIDFKKLVGEKWEPGKNLPFDPLAADRAAHSGLKVVFSSGRDMDNLKNIFYGKPFHGTLIHA